MGKKKSRNYGEMKNIGRAKGSKAFSLIAIQMLLNSIKKKKKKNFKFKLVTNTEIKFPIFVRFALCLIPKNISHISLPMY